MIRDGMAAPVSLGCVIVACTLLTYAYLAARFAARRMKE